jgi:hypothetical protein
MHATDDGCAAEEERKTAVGVAGIILCLVQGFDNGQANWHRDGFSLGLS